VLNYLLVPLTSSFGFLRVFQYISFRAAGAAVTALLLSFIVGPMIIRRLRLGRVAQVVRAGTPDTHAGKGRTPTMGGLIILIATIVPTLLWARLTNR
jgi:phospho-N-acetylmuramoyl-pentapeptide-transferase